MTGGLELTRAGERLVLLAERAVAWPARATLVVADPHWGKAATLRRAGIPVPPGGTAGDLRRLDAALARAEARRLVILGDLYHARSGRLADSTRATIAAWRARHPALEIVLVRGNHDRHAGDPDAELGIACMDEPWHEGPFAFRHHPDGGTGAFVLAGHVHPVARIAGPGRQALRLPAFLAGPDRLLLPAFGSFTGGAETAPAPGDQVVVIAEETLIELPAGARPVHDR